MTDDKKDGENVAMSLMEGNILKFSGDDNTYSSTKWAHDIKENGEIFGWTLQQKCSSTIINRYGCSMGEDGEGAQDV